MSAIYNEIDPYAAQWLRNLIAAGHIAPGVVDERSIVDIDPNELAGYTQVHCFAGIGVWSYALRLAGWPDARPVWTGSCPCQPFSAAGKRGGHEDERHLWPAWHRLIRECAPAIVFGEQVASADGRAWLDVVLAGLEDDHYAVAAADLSAAGVGAPHIRQRLYFVADAGQEQRGRWPDERQSRREDVAERHEAAVHDQRCSGAGLVADAELPPQARQREHGGALVSEQEPEGSRLPSNARTFWSDVDWLPCRDGKARPTQPGLFPLAHGAPSRVGRLRAYGNAIVPQVAAAFIEAAVTT